VSHKHRERVRSHCGDKLRHATRIDCVLALAATRHLVSEERMEPYPCKFCHGWHNGHPQIQPLMEFEPRCFSQQCGHLAMSHDRNRGLGCFECDCLCSQEYVYRMALRVAVAKHAELVRSKQNAERIVRIVFRLIPGAVRLAMRESLTRALRRS
jgi:hypothetical protein